MTRPEVGHLSGHSDWRMNAASSAVAPIVVDVPLGFTEPESLWPGRSRRIRELVLDAQALVLPSVLEIFGQEVVRSVRSSSLRERLFEG